MSEIKKKHEVVIERLPKQ